MDLACLENLGKGTLTDFTDKLILVHCQIKTNNMQQESFARNVLMKIALEQNKPVALVEPYI